MEERKKGEREGERKLGVEKAEWIKLEAESMCVCMHVWSTTLIYCHSHNTFCYLCIIIATIITIVTTIHCMVSAFALYYSNLKKNSESCPFSYLVIRIHVDHWIRW